MKWDFRTKLFLASAGLLATAGICADLYLSRQLDAQFTERIRNDLLVRLALVESPVANLTAGLGDRERWDALADDLGRRSATRVTIMRKDGTIIGDSEVALDRLATTENHATRPEVIEALRTGAGSGRRLSETVGLRMIYEARPFSRSGEVAGVVRVAMPLTEVDRAIVRVHRILGTGLLLSLALALLVSSVVAHLMTRDLRLVIQTTRRMARGDLDVRVHVATADELGELGNTLNRLVGNLSVAMQDLRAERDRLGRILEAMEEGVLVVDATRTVVLTNRALHTMLSSNEEPVPAPPTHDMIGRSIEMIHIADLSVIIDRTLASGLPNTGEIEVGADLGRRLLVHAAPLSGNPAGCLVVLVDVTEMRRLEAVRRDFVANVSHELRTPVAVLRTGVETARSVLQKDVARADHFLDIVERNAARLTALINDLLDLSRIESGYFKVDMQPLDVAPLLSQALLLFQTSAEKRRLELQADLPSDLPPAWADAAGLEHVLANLLDNAVKYSAEGGGIVVRARVDGEVIRISVVDQGPGIEAKNLPRLFERFYRVDPGRSRDRGGTGLGLAIVKHLAETMAGSVAVESAVGKGSTFTITLRVAKPAAPAVERGVGPMM